MSRGSPPQGTAGVKAVLTHGGAWRGAADLPTRIRGPHVVVAYLIVSS